MNQTFRTTGAQKLLCDNLTTNPEKLDEDNLFVISYYSSKKAYLLAAKNNPTTYYIGNTTNFKTVTYKSDGAVWTFNTEKVPGAVVLYDKKQENILGYSIIDNYYSLHCPTTVPITDHKSEAVPGS